MKRGVPRSMLTSCVIGWLRLSFCLCRTITGLLLPRFLVLHPFRFSSHFPRKAGVVDGRIR